MSDVETALKFVRSFCGGDIEGLVSTLALRFRLKGPLAEFDSPESYIAALKKDPPEKGGHRILDIAERPPEVTVLYAYEKGNSELIIAQLFQFEEGLIRETRLAFETGAPE